LIDFIDNPGKQVAVEMLGKCISGLVGLLKGQGLDNHLVPDSSAFFCQSSDHGDQIDSEKFRAINHVLLTLFSWSDVVTAFSFCKSDITKIKHCNHAI